MLPEKYVPDNVHIVKCTKELNLYGDKASIMGIGTAKLPVVNPKNKERYDVSSVVVKENCMPLIGASTAQWMKLIKVKYENIALVSDETKRELKSKQEVIETYIEMFEGHGTRLTRKVHLEVDNNVTPVAMSPRRVPLTVNDKIKE